MSTKETISLDINYNAIFQNFQRDIVPSTEYLIRRCSQQADTDERLVLLRAFNGVLSSINIALGAATSVEDINTLRDTCGEAQKRSSSAIRKLEIILNDEEDE